MQKEWRPSHHKWMLVLTLLLLPLIALVKMPGELRATLALWCTFFFIIPFSLVMILSLRERKSK